MCANETQQTNLSLWYWIIIAICLQIKTLNCNIPEGKMFQNYFTS